MGTVDPEPESEAAARERARQSELYEATEHAQKWDRFISVQKAQFSRSVIDAKRIFDCFGMVSFSASIFGLAIALQLSQPMDQSCERPISLAFVLLALLGVAATYLALQPLRRWGIVTWASHQRREMMPYPFRLAGRRHGASFIDGWTVLALAGVLALAYGIAHQIVVRVPDQLCVPPLP